MKTKDFEKYLNNVLLSETKKLIKEQVENDGLLEKVKTFKTLHGLVDKISVAKLTENGIDIVINDLTSEELINCCGGTTVEDAQNKLLKGLHNDLKENGFGDNFDIDLSIDGENNLFSLQIIIISGENLGNEYDELDETFPPSNDNSTCEPCNKKNKKSNKLILGDKQMNEQWDDDYQDEISTSKNKARRKYNIIDDAIEYVGGEDVWNSLTTDEQSEVINDIQKDYDRHFNLGENYDELSSDENDELNDKWGQWGKEADDEWREREDEKWNQLTPVEKFEELFSSGGDGFRILNINDFDYVGTKENDKIIAIGVEPDTSARRHKHNTIEELLSDLQQYLPELEIVGHTKHRYAPELKGATYIGIRKEINESKNMKNKKVLRLTESELVKFIKKIVTESEVSQPFTKSVGKTKVEKSPSSNVPGLDVTKKSQNDSKNENDENQKNVGKKMKEYLSFDGNDNPEFPKQIGKGEKVARENTSDQEQEIEDNKGRGPQDLNYDVDFGKKQTERIKKALSGDSTMGNEQDDETGNIVKSDLGKKIEKNAKRKQEIKKEEPLYNRAAVPTSTNKKNINEEVEKMKNLFNYNQKTQ